jgi:hypothetical protein
MIFGMGARPAVKSTGEWLQHPKHRAATPTPRSRAMRRMPVPFFRAFRIAATFLRRIVLIEYWGDSIKRATFSASKKGSNHRGHHLPAENDPTLARVPGPLATFHRRPQFAQIAVDGSRRAGVDIGQRVARAFAAVALARGNRQGEVDGLAHMSGRQRVC